MGGADAHKAHANALGHPIKYLSASKPACPLQRPSRNVRADSDNATLTSFSLATHPFLRNVYSALNAVAGHYNSFGTKYALPAKRAERVEKARIPVRAAAAPGPAFVWSSARFGEQQTTGMAPQAACPAGRWRRGPARKLLQSCPIDGLFSRRPRAP